MASVTIPNSVTSIGIGAFAGSTTLGVVCNYATTPQTIYDYVFSGNPESAILYVPDESLEEYKASDWKDWFAQILPLSEYDPSGIKDIQGQNPAAKYDGIYSISGARRPALQKGLNIIGGKKMLIK